MSVMTRMLIDGEWEWVLDGDAIEAEQPWLLDAAPPFGDPLTEEQKAAKIAKAIERQRQRQSEDQAPGTTPEP